MQAHIIITSIHAHADESEGSVDVVKVRLDITLERFSRDDRECEYKFRVQVLAGVGEIDMAGVLYLRAETEDELKELSRMAIESKKEMIPDQVIHTVMLLVTPLLTHIEKEMGIPITPLTPAPREKSLMYQ